MPSALDQVRFERDTGMAFSQAMKDTRMEWLYRLLWLVMRREEMLSGEPARDFDTFLAGLQEARLGSAQPDQPQQQQVEAGLPAQPPDLEQADEPILDQQQQGEGEAPVVDPTSPPPTSL